MKKKNVYGLYLLVNISDFSLFFMWKLQPLWKKSPPLSKQHPLKTEILWSPPFCKFGQRLNLNHTLQMGRGQGYTLLSHYDMRGGLSRTIEIVCIFWRRLGVIARAGDSRVKTPQEMLLNYICISGCYQ